MNLAEHADIIWGMAFTSDGKLLASGGKDYTVRLWDTVTGQQRNILRGYTDYVSCLVINADGSILVSGSWNRELRAWNLSDGSLQNVFMTDAPISCIALSPDT